LSQAEGKLATTNSPDELCSSPDVKTDEQLFESIQNTQNSNVAEIASLKAEIKAITDLTDDVLSSTSNALVAADTLISTYLLILTLVVTVAVAFIGFWFEKRRQDHLDEATRNFVDRLSHDDDLRKTFAGTLVQHPNIVQNINTAIDRASRVIAQPRDNSKDLHEISDALAPTPNTGKNK